VKILGLKPSQRVQGRWLVQLEDGTLLRVGENEVLAFSLYQGRELDEEERQRLLDSARKNGLKEKALNLLTGKPMSRRELERKLEQWEATEEESAAICDRMEELGFLNDEAYAQTVVRHYSAKGYGERKLRDELYRRGVPREHWEQALEQARDPEEAIRAFVEKKLAGKAGDPKELKKVSDALIRRGYRWQEISPVLDRWRQDSWEF
jgi:regulatory protein